MAGTQETLGALGPGGQVIPEGKRPGDWVEFTHPQTQRLTLGTVESVGAKELLVKYTRFKTIGKLKTREPAFLGLKIEDATPSKKAGQPIPSQQEVINPPAGAMPAADEDDRLARRAELNKDRAPRKDARDAAKPPKDDEAGDEKDDGKTQQKIL